MDWSLQVANFSLIHEPIQLYYISNERARLLLYSLKYLKYSSSTHLCTVTLRRFTSFEVFVQYLGMYPSFLDAIIQREARVFPCPSRHSSTTRGRSNSRILWRSYATFGYNCTMREDVRLAMGARLNPTQSCESYILATPINVTSLTDL